MSLSQRICSHTLSKVKMKHLSPVGLYFSFLQLSILYSVNHKLGISIHDRSEFLKFSGVSLLFQEKIYIPNTGTAVDLYLLTTKMPFTPTEILAICHFASKGHILIYFFEFILRESNKFMKIIFLILPFLTSLKITSQLA